MSQSQRGMQGRQFDGSNGGAIRVPSIGNRSPRENKGARRRAHVPV